MYVLKFVYKQNNLLPNIFNNFYTKNEDIHSHNTKQRGKNTCLTKLPKHLGKTQRNMWAPHTGIKYQVHLHNLKQSKDSAK